MPAKARKTTVTDKAIAPVHLLYPCDNDVANVLHLFLANVVNRHGNRIVHFTIDALWRAFSDDEATTVARMVMLAVVSAIETRPEGLASDLHATLTRNGMRLVMVNNMNCVRGAVKAWRAMQPADIQRLHARLTTGQFRLMPLRVEPLTYPEGV